MTSVSEMNKDEIDGMKSVSEMSKDEIDEAFSIVMDSAKQQEMLDNPGNPNSWMMCFVYDQTLFRELEDFYSMQ